MRKRMLSFLLALCTLLTLCVPAFAAEEDTFAQIVEPAIAEEAAEAPEEPEAPVLPEGPDYEQAPEEMETVPEVDVPVEAVVDVSAAEPEADRPVTAASGKCGANVTWDLTGGVLTISGTGDMENYEAQENFEKDKHAPWYGERVTSVVIKDGVTSIGDLAFTGLSQLTSVTIPESVTKIGVGAFDNCSSLTSIRLPSRLTRIGAQAFYECKALKSITIPDTVTYVGYAAFFFCDDLASAVLSAGMTVIDQLVFAKCTSLRTVTIPSSSKMTIIGASAFDGCTSLTGITLPSSLTTIQKSAFYGCASLKSITIPASVTAIDESAFQDCTSLSSVTMGSSVKQGPNAFANTPWLKSKGSFVISNGVLVTYQGSGGSVTIPSSVTKIGERAFTGRADVTSVTIPSTVTEIGTWAFGETGLRSVTIPRGVKTIGAAAFSGCMNMSSVSIPSTVTTIGDEAFCLCQSLKSVTIPEGVTTIGDHAFQDCGTLHTVSLPSTLKTLGADALTSYNLRKIVVNGGASFTYGYADKNPSIIVYSNGAGTARSYASAIGATHRDISKQHQNGWQSEGGAWYYFNDGKMLANQWQSYAGTWCFLGADGKMLTGLQNIELGRDDDGRYYFDPSSGAMLTGWQESGDNRYYFNPTNNSTYGIGMTGWIADGGGYYYCDPSTGAMLTGWQTIGGKRYYFNPVRGSEYGKRASGWLQIGATWYYFNSQGVLEQTSSEPPAGPTVPAGWTGWLEFNGAWYYFRNGEMKKDYWVTDSSSHDLWYHVGADGTQDTGFQYITDATFKAGWFMLKVGNSNGDEGAMLTGWKDTGTSAGWGYFEPSHNGNYGYCTYTDAWGNYNARTGLWADGQTHR